MNVSGNDGTSNPANAKQAPAAPKLSGGSRIIVRGDVDRRAVVIRDEMPSPFATVRYLDGTYEHVHRSLVRPAG